MSIVEHSCEGINMHPIGSENTLENFVNLWLTHDRRVMQEDTVGLNIGDRSWIIWICFGPFVNQYTSN